jgi:hypothetical protein
MLWVEERLLEWSDWARGNHLSQPQSNPLADMIRRAAGEVRGRDLDMPYELTFSIEATDKAVAMLKLQNRRYKRLIMRYWMGRVPVFEISADMRMSEERVREMLLRAHGQVGRNIYTAEETLTKRNNSEKLRSSARG